MIDPRNPFKLRSPCSECPFRTDILPFLRRGRAQAIVESMQNSTFSCHKTVDYDAADLDLRDRAGEMVCAGSIIMAHKSGTEGRMLQIAERLGLYDRSTMKMGEPVFDSPDEFIQAQEE